MKEWLRGKLASFLGIPELIQKSDGADEKLDVADRDFRSVWDRLTKAEELLAFYDREFPQLKERIEHIETAYAIAKEAPQRVRSRTWSKVKSMMAGGVSEDDASR